MQRANNLNGRNLDKNGVIERASRKRRKGA